MVGDTTLLKSFIMFSVIFMSSGKKLFIARLQQEKDLSISQITKIALVTSH